MRITGVLPMVVKIFWCFLVMALSHSLWNAYCHGEPVSVKDYAKEILCVAHQSGYSSVISRDQLIAAYL